MENGGLPLRGGSHAQKGMCFMVGTKLYISLIENTTNHWMISHCIKYSVIYVFFVEYKESTYICVLNLVSN